MNQKNHISFASPNLSHRQRQISVRMAANAFSYVIAITLCTVPPILCNGYGYGGGAPNNAYDPYRPYNYPYPYPLPPNPTKNPINPINPPSGGAGTVVAFAFTRARKNNQCLNLHMCFIQFDNEVTKINAVTYPSYGAFQAPIAGLYFFTFTLALGGGVQPRVSLRRNNDVIAAVNASVQPVSSTEHMPVTYAILLQLQAHTAVYIVIENGDIIENQNPADGPLNSFSGFLISPITTNTTTVGTNGGTFGAPGAPGSPGVPGLNFGGNGIRPSGNTFPTNINGMPPFQTGRSDSDPDINLEPIA